MELLLARVDIHFEAKRPSESLSIYTWPEIEDNSILDRPSCAGEYLRFEAYIDMTKQCLH